MWHRNDKEKKNSQKSNETWEDVDVGNQNTMYVTFKLWITSGIKLSDWMWKKSSRQGEDSKRLSRTIFGVWGGLDHQLIFQHIRKQPYWWNSHEEIKSIHSRVRRKQSSCCDYVPVSTHFTVSAWRHSSSELWEVKHKHIWPFCCTRCLKRLAHILFRDEICWQESNDYFWFLSSYQF